MPEKMEFCRSLGINLLVSQSCQKSIHDIYENELGIKAVGIPNGGFDDSEFQIYRNNTFERTIDIGFRAYDEPLYFGHQRRRNLMDFFLESELTTRLTFDFSMDSSKRFGRNEYFKFLGNCYSQLGTGGGTDYFDLTDNSRNSVNDLIKANPNIMPFEVFQFLEENFKKERWVNLSTRIAEAAATKSLLILHEDINYPLLKPDVHYISVNPLTSSPSELYEKIMDKDFLQKIISNAFELSYQKLTFEKHIDRLINDIKSNY